MVDARGYSCPVPLMMLQNAIQSEKDPRKLEIAVDHQCAIENITRFGKDHGYQVKCSDYEGDFLLTLTK